MHWFWNCWWLDFTLLASADSVPNTGLTDSEFVQIMENSFTGIVNGLGEVVKNVGGKIVVDEGFGHPGNLIRVGLDV